ncbi:MAG: hypothetical protein PUD34_03905 [bacterium]|nr:hypothetical protein [bacterium]
MLQTEFQKVLTKMDYKTYKHLYDSIKYTWVISASASLAITASTLDLNVSPALLSLVLGCLTLNFSFNNFESYTTDFNNLRTLYQEFLINYRALLQQLSLTDPVEIYALFSYMLHQGYLSVNSQFIIQNIHSNINGLYGSQVLCNQACCRHISSLLVDVFKSMGYASGIYCGYYAPNKNGSISDALDISKFNLPNYQLERPTAEISKSLFQSILEECFGNHAITYVTNNQKIYFFDPNEILLYTPLKDKMTLTDGVGTLKFRRLMSTQINADSSQLQKDLAQNYEPNLLLTQYAQIARVWPSFQENNDELSKFYSDNNHLYQEITAEVKKLKLKLYGHQ